MHTVIKGGLGLRSKFVYTCAAFSWTSGAGSSRVRAQFRQGTVAFGPQHPAAHGILKLQMQLHGEVLR